MLMPVRTTHPALFVFFVLLSFSLAMPVVANPTGDSDGDGVVDTVDQDDDNDGIEDRMELADNGQDRDSDNDGIPDRFDLDSDNDGIPDLYESGLFVAVSGAGIRVVNGRLLAEVGENGLVDSIETSPDSSFVRFTILNSDIADGDVVPDYLDLDSDNDGILDLVEAGVSPGFDTDRNGRVDLTIGSVGRDGILDVLQLNVDLTCCDLDLDGIQEEIPRNTDGGDLPDFQDLDSDNDGVNDLIEAGGRDADQDGRIDGFFDDASRPDGVDDVLFIVPLRLPDSDRNGIPDYIDAGTANLPGSEPVMSPPVATPQPDPVADAVPVEPALVIPSDDAATADSDAVQASADVVVASGPIDDVSAGALVPVQTGVNGGVGCVISQAGRGPRDSGLVTLLLIAALGYFFRRRRSPLPIGGVM